MTIDLLVSFVRTLYFMISSFVKVSLLHFSIATVSTFILKMVNVNPLICSLTVALTIIYLVYIKLKLFMFDVDLFMTMEIE
jgi:hypothetical protein